MFQIYSDLIQKTIIYLVLIFISTSHIDPDSCRRFFLNTNKHHIHESKRKLTNHLKLFQQNQLIEQITEFLSKYVQDERSIILRFKDVEGTIQIFWPVLYRQNVFLLANYTQVSGHLGV